MNAIIVGWDPANRKRWNYAAIVEQVSTSGLHLEPWGVGRSVAAGTDVWLLLLGANHRGLIGHGVVVGEDTVQPQVAFDALLPLGDQVPAEILNKAMPGVAWESTEIEGLAVGPGDAAAIRSLWAEFGPLPGPHPTELRPGTYPDEAVTRVPLNRYERDPEARRACIAHRGSSCAVCGFSFEVAYGEIGKDFIDVHHVVPPGRLGGDYQLDPLTDLVPLCANCHAMAHHAVTTPRTEVELRRAIADAGFLTGSVVTPAELEAQRVALEILGPH